MHFGQPDRPVPLDEGLLLGDGRFRYIDGVTGQERISDPLIRRDMLVDSSQDWVIPLVRKLVGEGERVIVFREKNRRGPRLRRLSGDGSWTIPARDALADRL